MIDITETITVNTTRPVNKTAESMVLEIREIHTHEVRKPITRNETIVNELVIDTITTEYKVP
jgi:hypothetical protein